jgi:uncharacterized SAM-binding protein YcdF (DUF218 family)
MFLLLSKIIPVFVYPLGLSLLLLGVAAALRRRAAWTRALCFSAFLLLFLFSSSTVSQLLLRSLEKQYPQLPMESIPQAEAIVVLGGSTSRSPASPDQAPELDSASDRLLYAARLFRAGKAPLILFSGGAVPFLTSRPGGSEAEAATQLLKEWAVPGQAILLEDKSRNTRENALFSRPILQSRRISLILLVTSASHMPRASAVFRKVGFQVIPAPADFQTGDDEGLLPRILPDAGSLANSELALKEWLGLIVYRLRGWT